MQILGDLHNETKRLFIAGSKFAKNDPRISKYIPALEKMSEKAPVMKKLVEKYAILLTDGQPEALADAGTFLYAVMATQGTTEVSGEAVQEEPSLRELPKTRTPYSRLKPVLDALTYSRQGRYEVIRTAFEEGLLNDFRLYAPLAAGLDDKYAELAEYLCETVIPALGAPLIPYLLERYDPKGKRSDAMRLSLLDKLGYEEAGRLALAAVEDGAPVVVVEGIQILGADSGNEEYLLKLAEDKKAAVREAALIGLVRMDSPRGKELMVKTLQGGRYKSAVQAAKLCQSPEYTQKMLNIVRRHYEGLLESSLTDKDFTEANSKFCELFGVLENKDEPAVFELFKDILKNKVYAERLNVKSAHYHFHDAQRLVCDLLSRCADERLIEVCEDALSADIVKKSSGMLWQRYFTAVRDSYPPERLFDVFAAYYDANLTSFLDLFFPGTDFFPKERGCYAYDREAEFERIRSSLDLRWIKQFIKKEDLPALSVCLQEGGAYEKEIKGVILKKAMEGVKKKQASMLIGYAVDRFVEVVRTKKSILFKSELEKMAEVCLAIFENAGKIDTHYFYRSITEKNLIKLFCPKYTEKFKALAEQKSFDVLYQIAEELQRAESPQ